MQRVKMDKSFFVISHYGKQILFAGYTVFAGNFSAHFNARTGCSKSGDLPG